MPEVSQKVKLEYLFFPAAGDNYATFLLLFNNEQRQSPCLDLWPREYLHGSSYILASLNIYVKKENPESMPCNKSFQIMVSTNNLKNVNKFNWEAKL